jgi:predicted RNA-binding Zn ribbon-like protein
VKLVKLNTLANAGVVNTEGFYKVGGRTAMDFANSARRFGKEGEGLEQLEELLSFLKSLGHLHEDEASDYHMFLFQNRDRCNELMKRLRELRAKFIGVLVQMADGWPVDPSFVSDVNERLAGFTTRLEIVSADEGYAVKTVLVEEGPERLIYPILKDIAEFMASDQLTKVRKCASDSCDLFFINQSRNGRRRWCSMSTCGNRAKVNAYLKRKDT